MVRTLQIMGILLLVSAQALFAQTNEWATDYVTLDDPVNGTLNRTTSVAVVDSNHFVALITRNSAAGGDLINYLAGYVNADSVNGRLSMPPVLGSGVGSWAFILDRVDFADAFQIASGSDNLVYLANNDANHNVLVFELTTTEVASSQFRMETGSDMIWGIEVDDNGYVYVCDLNGDDSKTDEVRIYPPVTDGTAAWGTSHDSSPVTTIDLPPGEYRGITTSGDGTQVFISQSSERTILKYTGTPESGYAADASFGLTLDPADMLETPSGTIVPTVLGLGFLNDPPALFAAVDTLFFGGEDGGYAYGRVYVIDPATGTNNDTIDVAQWNFDQNGSFTDASSKGRSGGFTSVMDVDVEAGERAVYSQTWFGWAVEKWLFDGDLGTVVSVEPIPDVVPTSFTLGQNYPNPFNPSTTIEFEIQQAGFVTLSVYNMLGQKVTTLVNERLSPGAYKTTFEASQFPSGIFFYSLDTASFRETKKMVFLK